MSVTLYLTLPHPLDGVLNYGLAILRDAMNADHRVLCHGDTNSTPLQRHSRNLLHGVDSRRDNVLRTLDWAATAAQGKHLHVYSRFFLADFTVPPSLQGSRNFLELAWLYFARHTLRLVMVDFDEAPGSARAYCSEMCRRKVLDEGGSELNASEAATEYFEAWSFRTAELLQAAAAIVPGTTAIRVSLDCQAGPEKFLEQLRDAMVSAHPAPAPQDLVPLHPGSEPVAALERLLGRLQQESAGTFAPDLLARRR